MGEAEIKENAKKATEGTYADGNKFRVILNFLKEKQSMHKTWENIFLSKKIVKTSCAVPCIECQEKWRQSCTVCDKFEKSCAITWV